MGHPVYCKWLSFIYYQIIIIKLSFCVFLFFLQPIHMMPGWLDKLFEVSFSSSSSSCNLQRALEPIAKMNLCVCLARIYTCIWFLDKYFSMFRKELWSKFFLLLIISISISSFGTMQIYWTLLCQKTLGQAFRLPKIPCVKKEHA